MKELTLDIASVVFMGHEHGGHDHELVTKVNDAFTTTTRSGGAIMQFAVPPFKWWRGLQRAQGAGGLLRRARQGSAATPGAPTCCRVLCHTERRGRQLVLRRGHRQPHDLPDDGRPRHLDVDDDHHGLQPGRQPGVAAALPRRVRPPRRRPARHRGAGQAGDPRPGDQRVTADGDTPAVQHAARPCATPICSATTCPPAPMW